MDANGEPIVAEVDESKYFLRKYHCGQWRDEHCIENHSGKCFLIVVPDGSAAFDWTVYFA